jgi:hypothetical protein
LQEQPQWLAWLLCCLLAALDDSLPSVLQQKHRQLLHQQQQYLNLSSSSTDEQAAATAAVGGLQAWGRQQAVELSAAELAQHLSGPLYMLGQQLGLTLCRAVAAATAAAAVGGSNAPHDLQHSSTAVRLQGFQGLVDLVDLLQAAVAEGSQQLAAVAGAVAAGMSAGCLEATAAAAAAGSAGAAAVEDVWASTVAAAAAVNPASARQQAAAGHHHNNRHATGQHSSRRVQQQMWARQQQQQQQQRSGVVSPQLEPDWVQQLQQQALLLAAAAEAACERCMQPAVPEAVAAASHAAHSAAANSVSSVSSVSHACKLVLGHAYSKLLSGHGRLLQQQQQQQQQQQRRQAHDASGILCSLSYLLDQSCSMSGLFHYAGCCGDAATTNSWLAAQQQQHQPHEVGMLVQWLATAVQKLQAQGMLQLLAALRQSAEALASSYSWYLQSGFGSNGAVLEGVDAAAARQQLDRLFAVHVALLAALWQQQQHSLTGPATAAASTAGMPAVSRQQQDLAAAGAVSSSEAGAGDLRTNLHAAIAAEGLATIAALQFCQVQLPSYVELLRSLVTAVASRSAAADAFLAAARPCYDSLLQPMLGQGGSWLQQQEQQQQTGEGAAGADKLRFTSSSSNGPEHSSSSSSAAARAWMANPVLVARLSFVVPLIPLAVKAASDQAAAAAASLPLLLLLVPHPVAAVAQAAHSAVAGLFSITASSSPAADAQTAEAAGGDEQSKSQQQQQQQLLLQQTLGTAVPLYLQRSLDALPGFGSMEGLAVGFNSIIRQLPAGSVMALLAVKLIADRAVQLAQQGSGSSSSRQQQQHHQQKLLYVSNKLFELVQLALQVVDYALLPSVLQLVSAAVLAAPAAVQRGWLSELYGSCLAVDDYTRKPGLVAWIDGLARQVALISETQQQQQQQQHGLALD